MQVVFILLIALLRRHRAIEIPQRKAKGARAPYGRGWLWFWPVDHPNSPLRPAAVDREGGQSERHRVSPPHARSWLCPHLPIDTHCTHVRAGLLLLRASVPRPRLAAPFPPVLPAARANGTRAAQSRAYTNNRVGGWEIINDLSRVDRELLGLPVGLGVDLGESA